MLACGNTLITPFSSIPTTQFRLHPRAGRLLERTSNNHVQANKRAEPALIREDILSHSPVVQIRLPENGVVPLRELW